VDLFYDAVYIGGGGGGYAFGEAGKMESVRGVKGYSASRWNFFR
jgi:hypothetical protein